MSRIGKMPVELPSGVTVNVKDRVLEVKGPKGTLTKELQREVEIEVKDEKVIVTRKNDTKHARSLHGTFRSVTANMVKGVNEGWEKKLELVGAGYKTQLEGKDLILIVGFSHPVKIEVPEGIEFKVEKTQITVSGIDKETVGHISAKIRAVRPPEPYKGKGIMYVGEEIRRKPGKAAKAVGAPA